jgi:hypothetical protein
MVMKDDHVRGARVSFYIDPAICGGRNWNVAFIVAQHPRHFIWLRSTRCQPEMRFYKYEPLKAKKIRLIGLKASSTCSYSTELLVCIRHASLNDSSKASYEALSYAWGDLTGRRSLYCRDGSYLMIMKSLFSALSSLRWRDRSL